MSERLGFLIDMDGVIYRGKQLIPGADRFIQRLLAEEISFAFLTNNSQRTRRDVATKLKARTFDRAALASRPLPYERLDQLVIDLLLGVR